VQCVPALGVLVRATISLAVEEGRERQRQTADGWEGDGRRTEGRRSGRGGKELGGVEEWAAGREDGRELFGWYAGVGHTSGRQRWKA